MDFLEYRDSGQWDKPQDVRKNCPYKIDDIINVNFGGELDGTAPVSPDIKPCKIKRIGTEYLIYGMYWIPVYWVWPLTKKGTWSKRARRAYPGDVYRAYEHKE